MSFIEYNFAISENDFNSLSINFDKFCKISLTIVLKKKIFDNENENMLFILSLIFRFDD